MHAEVQEPRAGPAWKGSPAADCMSRYDEDALGCPSPVVQVDLVVGPCAGPDADGMVRIAVSASGTWAKAASSSMSMICIVTGSNGRLNRLPVMTAAMCSEQGAAGWTTPSTATASSARRCASRVPGAHEMARGLIQVGLATRPPSGPQHRGVGRDRIGGGPAREQTRRMILPTVIEITPQLEAVTPDTFIDRWAAVARAGKEPARDRTLIADRER
jgi:hypothetical protein